MQNAEHTGGGGREAGRSDCCCAACLLRLLVVVTLGPWQFFFTPPGRPINFLAAARQLIELKQSTCM
jgi:hypothetical protein